jgi:hypothetical protein
VVGEVRNVKQRAHCVVHKKKLNSSDAIEGGDKPHCQVGLHPQDARVSGFNDAHRHMDVSPPLGTSSRVGSHRA